MTDLFPDAETVRKQAESAAAELRSVRLGSVRATVEAAVKKGLFCTTVSNLRLEDELFLRSKGYTVRSQGDQREPSSDSSISWARPT